MASIRRLLGKIESSPGNVRFAELAAVCEHFFGPPRQKGTSHHVYKTPWPGDPRVNIQKGKNGEAKRYQVKQVIAAIRKLDALKREQGDG